MNLLAVAKQADVKPETTGATTKPGGWTVGIADRAIPRKGLLPRSAGVARAQRIIRKAGRTLSASKGTEVAVTYQSVVRFVPQTEGE